MHQCSVFNSTLLTVMWTFWFITAESSLAVNPGSEALIGRCCPPLPLGGEGGRLYVRVEEI